MLCPIWREACIGPILWFHRLKLHFLFLGKGQLLSSYRTVVKVVHNTIYCQCNLLTEVF
jgi:hypothetical protein